MTTTNKKRIGLFTAYLLLLILAVGITWNVGYNSGRQDQLTIHKYQTLVGNYRTTLSWLSTKAISGEGGELYDKVALKAESLHEEILSYDLKTVSDARTLHEIKRAKSSHENILEKLKFVKDQGGVKTEDGVNLKALDVYREAEVMINYISYLYDIK